jgi:acetyltransferase-like isoleucine patch superfamily enzyme
MKKLTILLFCFCLTSCYFGQNESCEEIVKNFYLAKWDENTWISYSKDDNNIFDTEKIIIGHNVFAVGNNEDFIVGKQHPCANKDAHFMDYDSLKPNRAITNYFIIDTRNDNFKLHSFNNENDFDNWKNRLGIPKSLPYHFYDMDLE